MMCMTTSSDSAETSKLEMILAHVRDVFDEPMESLYSVLVNIGIVLMAVLVLLVSANVVLRYVFGSSLFFGNAMSRYLAIWFSLLLVGPLLKNDEHLGVDVLVRRFTLKTRSRIRIAELIGIVVLGVLMTYWGLEYTLTFGFITSDPATGIDMFWFYSALPVSGFFIIVFGAYKLIEVIRNPAIVDEDYERQYGSKTIKEVTEE